MSSAWSRLWETSLQSAADRGQHGAAQTPSARGPHPELRLPRSVLLPIWETRGRRSWPQRCIHAPCPPCPAGLGASWGAGFTPPHGFRTQEAAQRSPGPGTQMLLGGWGCPEIQWGTNQTKGRDPGGGPRSTATVTAWLTLRAQGTA